MYKLFRIPRGPRISLFARVASVVATGVALAWTYLGNINSGTKSWSPYSGEKWGQIAYAGSGRYLDAEGRNWYYGDRVITMQVGGFGTQMVLHAFRQNTNCYVPMNATGYWWTNYPNPTPTFKTALCGTEAGGSAHNEFRAQPDLMQLNSTGYYYAGAEYQDWAYDGVNKTAGELNFDAYAAVTCVPPCKEWLGKYYFESNDSLHN